MEMLPRALPGGYWSRRCAPPPSLYRAPPWHRAGQIAPFTGRRRAFRRSRCGNEEEKRGELDGSGSSIKQPLLIIGYSDSGIGKSITCLCLYHTWKLVQIGIIMTKLKTPWAQLLMQSHLQPIITIIISPVSQHWLGKCPPRSHLTSNSSNIQHTSAENTSHIVDNEYILCAFIQFKIPNIEY